MSQELRVYCPADVRAGRVPFTSENDPRCGIGGRVVFCDGLHVRIADAFAVLNVQLRQPLALEMGCLVELDGVLARLSTAGEAELSDALVQAVHPGQYLAQGDFSRFNRSARLLQQRQFATQAVRNLLSVQGFLEVETPTRVLAAGTDVYLDPVASGSHWLITSPEFHLKRLLVGGVPRVFEFARCFRADEVGRWHQPQFTLLEWYRAFEAYDAVMRDTEAIIACAAQALTAGEQIRVGQYRVNLAAPFERLSVRTVFQRYAQVPNVAALALNDENRYFEHWVNDVEPALAELGRPVFVTEFPLSQAALARPCTNAPDYAERFELFAGGVELCNGYGELTCASTQQQRFEHDVARRAELGRPSVPIDGAFLQALHEGMPRASGNALGFERLLALLLESPLSDVVAFPESF